MACFLKSDVILFFFNVFDNRINSSLDDCRYVRPFGGIQKDHSNGGFPDCCAVSSNYKEFLVWNCCQISRTASRPHLFQDYGNLGIFSPNKFASSCPKAQLTHIHFKDNTFVITPKVVYSGDEGFFFTPSSVRQKVAFISGCVTWGSFWNENPLA